MPAGALVAIRQVLPGAPQRGACAWRAGDQYWLALTTSEEVGWRDSAPADAASILRILSPLRVVVAAWRQHLRSALTPQRQFTRAYYEDPNDAAKAIAGAP